MTFLSYLVPYHILPSFPLSGPYFASDPATRANFGLANLNWTDIDLSYYDSMAYLTDTYAYLATLSDVAWNVTLRPHDAPRGPLFLAPALSSGLEEVEVVSYLRAMLWSMQHSNLATDPQLLNPVRLLVGNAAAQALMVRGEGGD